MTRDEMLEKAKKYAANGQTTLTRFWELRADGNTAGEAFDIMRAERS